MSNKVIYAIYNDDDILMDAKKPEQLIIISKKFYPFRSRFDNNGACANQLFVHLVYCIGISFAMMKLYYDPRAIGESRFSYIENMPAFVPIMFEMMCFLRRI
jgi:hypothetical protein